MRLLRLPLLLLTLIAIPAAACTNLIVGRGASADGSVMITYSADDYGSYGYLHYYPAADHPADARRDLYDYETNNYLGYIPEAPHTYQVIGQVNEHQLAIMETTFGGREELVDTTGLLDYGSLMYVTLQRARTAREAITIWTNLIDTYGYRSEGESITLADPREVWVLELIGKGTGQRGAVWVARRVPDDCVTGHANQARITRFPLHSPDSCIYSPDVITFARQKGYYQGPDSCFSFRDAYAPNDFSARRICDARVWSFYNRVATGMDRYLPYILGFDANTEELPWCIRPDHPVTLRQLKHAMRDHYEGTPLDMTLDLGAGPYQAPYRPTPLFYEVDSVRYFNERPISTQQTAVTYLAQLRSNLPNHIGALLWVGFDDANMVPYTPVYAATTICPRPYDQATADPFTFSIHSAYWLQNALSNFVYPRYSQLFPTLQAYRDSLDDQYESLQAKIETEAQALPTQEAIRHLTAYTQRSADLMMLTWQELFQHLIVRYNDQTIKPMRDGQYLRTAGGDHVPVTRPGYPDAYRQAIVRQTGDRYRVR